MDGIELRAPQSFREWEASYRILAELRQGLTRETFDATLAAAQGYTLLGAFVDDRCIAVVGYRILVDFVHGRHLYIDDLIVTDAERSRGFGATLLRECEVIAQRERCVGLRLCTGVDNEDGRRFYEREGWVPRAFAFKKKLAEA